MQSKEEKVLELFFNSPTREWHFEEILKEAGIARSKADRWLKKFARHQLVRRVKERGNMPYYVADHGSPSYRNRKRIFAQNMLYQSGFLNHLCSLHKAKAIVLFGSLARWDWYKGSDIDVFIYGDTEGLGIAKYELKLHRNIQLFACRSKEELAKFSPGLIRNIIKGSLIKGDLDFVKVTPNA